MRQEGRRGVAPLNTNPKWPEGYVLAAREAGALEKTIPFLLTWVRRFFARFPGRNRRELGRMEIETFLSEMARRNEVSNWQIAQARDALELYYEQFRGIALAPRPNDDLQTKPSPTSSLQPASVDDNPIAADNDTSRRKPVAKVASPYQMQSSPVNVAGHEMAAGLSLIA